MLNKLLNRLRVVVKLKTDPGTYVGRAVVMPGATAEACGVSADPDMHCTQMYSLKSFPVTPLTNVVVVRPVKWGILGPENALVLFVESADLRFRFDELVAAGAEPTYPEYLPHITFFYYGEVPDPSVLGVPSGVPDIPIILGPEEVSTLAEDVFVEKFNPNHKGPGPGGGQFASNNESTIAQPASAYPIAQKSHDTLNNYSLDGGKTFTPERAKLHKAIIDSYFKKGATPVTKPFTIVMGGGPASGKSVLLKQGPPVENTIHVDPDEIKLLLPEFRENAHSNDPGSGTFVHEESSLLAKQVVARATKENYNLIVDGTGDNSYEKLEAKVNSLRSEGRTVSARYVTTDIETAIQRAHARGNETGRFVPEEYNREVHRNVSTVFEKAVRNGLFDETVLYDTNGPTPVKLMSAVGTKLKIHDELGWQRFLAKAQTNELLAPQAMPFVMGAPHYVNPVELKNYLASYGQEWKPAPLPKDVKLGKMGNCYENATQLVINNPNLRYAEGVAYSANTGKIPFLHGWAVTPEGTVIDPTWPESEHGRYFGVVYNREAYLGHILKTKFYGVLGGENNAARKALETGARYLRTGKRRAA